MANDRNNHRTKSLLFAKLWWDISLLVMAGGSLLSLVHTRESVCLLCLEACLQYLVHPPIWFLIGLEFSRHKQALCKGSIDLVFWGLCIFAWKYCFLPSWELQTQSKAGLTLIFILQPNTLYSGEAKGFIACVGAKGHNSILLKQLDTEEKEGPSGLFWVYVIPIYIILVFLFFPSNCLMLLHAYTQLLNSLGFGVIWRFSSFVHTYWASPVCSLGVTEGNKERQKCGLCLVQLKNFLVETWLEELNTQKDKQPTRAMHMGVDEWDVRWEHGSWGGLIVATSPHAVLRATDQYNLLMDWSNPDK